MNEPLTEIRFWAQVLGDSRRTVVCSPENESRIKTWVEAANRAHLISVLANRIVPDDQVYVIDEGALEASHRQVMQRARFQI